MKQNQTDFWEEPFFYNLNVEQKVFYIYLRDNVNENDVLDLDFDKINSRIGFTVDADFVSSFVDTVNSDQTRITKSGRLLKLSKKEIDPVDEFIRKQNEVARSGNPLKAPSN